MTPLPRLKGMLILEQYLATLALPSSCCNNTAKKDQIQDSIPVCMTKTKDLLVLRPEEATVVECIQRYKDMNIP